MVKTIKVIGAGLAGTETAWQLASLLEKNNIADFKVQLYEMRPQVKTPAHHTANFAELVCSNSLGSEFLTTARGVLIREMQHYQSLIIAAAQEAKVPAGQVLAVDRDIFAKAVTEKIEQHPLIEVIREEFTEDLSSLVNTDDYLVLATGPLTSPDLAKKIQELFAKNNPDSKSTYLHFFDAAAPIVEESSINMDIAFKASRYDKGVEEGQEGDYINCPFYDEAEFENFYQELINSEKAELKDFEKGFFDENRRFFDACQPIEQIASKGKQTLTFGPLKPVGLTDKRQPDKKAVAVVQLRQDNVVGSLYNIVGFQTNLKWAEQKRIFSMIPGLENLEIVRYGVMHQNIFINSPELLTQDLCLKNTNNIYFAGQITGVEGYTESAASGIAVAQSIISKIVDKQTKIIPEQTMLGSLCHYVSHCDPKRFQPINSNWGLLNKSPETLEKQYRKNKKLRYEFLAQRALASL